MNDILQIMANTIIANLFTTTSVGLIEGKMGLCLFFYEYGRHTSEPLYTEIAGRLLDEVIDTDKQQLSYDIDSGFAGIGIGLCYLLKNGFVDADAGSLLHDIDSRLLNNLGNSMELDKKYASGCFTSGMYLLARQNMSPDRHVLTNWIDGAWPYYEKIKGDYDRGRQLPVDIPLWQSFTFVLSVLRDKYGVQFPDNIEYDVDAEGNSSSIDGNVAVSHEVCGYTVHELLRPLIGLDSKVLLNDRLISYVAGVTSHFVYSIKTVNNDFALLGLNLLNLFVKPDE